MNINFYLKRLTVNRGNPHMRYNYLFDCTHILYATNILVHNRHHTRPQAKYIINLYAINY